MIAGTQRSYLPEVDGLRAIAVGTVFLFHLSPAILPGGFVGVDIFFVVSGFLITQQLATHIHQGRFSILGFYQRRIARIAPAALAVILAVFAAAALLYMRIDVERTGSQGIAAAVSAINFLLVFSGNYFDASAQSQPFLHYWSLAVEEQYYLFYPFALWWLLRRSRRPILWLSLAALASFALCAVLSRTDQSVAYYLLPTRAWELIAGALLALGRDRLRWTVEPYQGALLASGAVLALLSAIIVRPDNFPGFQALLPVAAGALVIAGAGSQAGIAGRLLASRPMLWLGTRSYVLYLWHWAVFSFVGYTLFDLGIWPMMALEIVITFALTMATHSYLEMPARRWLNAPQRRTVTLVLFAVAVAATCLAGQALRSSIRQPSASALRTGGLQVNPGGRQWVVVIGDSTAMVMHPELIRRASSLDARMTIMSRSQVNELPGERHSLWPRIARFLGNRKPDVLLVSEGWSFKLQALGEAKFAQAMRDLSSHADKVILVGEAPVPSDDALDRERIAQGIGTPTGPDAKRDALRRHWQERLQALDLDNVQFIPIDDLLMRRDGSLAVRDDSGKFLYYDRRHLSDAGLSRIYPRVFGALRGALHEKAGAAK